MNPHDMNPHPFPTCVTAKPCQPQPLDSLPRSNCCVCEAVRGGFSHRRLADRLARGRGLVRGTAVFAFLFSKGGRS